MKRYNKVLFWYEETPKGEVIKAEDFLAYQKEVDRLSDDLVNQVSYSAGRDNIIKFLREELTESDLDKDKLHMQLIMERREHAAAIQKKNITVGRYIAASFVYMLIAAVSLASLVALR